ncbi:anti-sigma factor domain-containing protein [Microbacterium sp. NPDC089695]|uniref:anti-sigma factor n=1 Tax=Microbacterium sp. NPDC089695 TaxID=3364198 RepID=UPI00381F6241
MNESEFRELAAGAALGALSPDDQQRYHAALAANAGWGDDVDADAETAALLAYAATPVTPPASIRAALMERIASTPQNGDSHVEPVRAPETTAAENVDERHVPAAHARRERRPLRILFALAACLALLVGVGVGTAAINDYMNRPASVVALDDIRGASDAQQATVQLADGGSATAHWSASLGTAVLVADGIATLPDDESYELWFVRGDEPVSAGVFDAHDGGATALLDGEMHEGDAIAVTVEQAGGSPTGTPTSEPIVVIPTA